MDPPYPPNKGVEGFQKSTRTSRKKDLKISTPTTTNYSKPKKWVVSPSEYDKTFSFENPKIGKPRRSSSHSRINFSLSVEQNPITRVKFSRTLSMEELIEGGGSRECLSDFCLVSKKTDVWQHYFVEISKDKTTMRMFISSNGTDQFLLSAKRIKNDFYISQYYSFPDEVVNKTEGADRFCCVVKHDPEISRSYNVPKLMPAYSQPPRG